MSFYIVPSSKPTPAAASVNDQPKKEPQSAIWKGFLVVVNFFYEIPAKVAALAAAGLALLIFFPAAAPPFLGISCSILITRLAIKILDAYHFKIIKDIEKKACELNQKYPKLQIIAFIGALVICSISHVFGFVIGAAIGVFSGILIGIDHCKHLQECKRADLKNPSYQTLNKISIT